LHACRAASQTLTAAGRVDPTHLGAADFTRIVDAMSDLRRAATATALTAWVHTEDHAPSSS
jgi:hypothetical protein